MLNFKSTFCAMLALLLALPAAAVMKPETSMVLIQEEDGGGSINVTNTSDSESLLYVKIYDLPDDKQPQLLVTQPVTRVAAGQVQRVRFVLNTSAPLTREHMKRVMIEGIPPQNGSAKNTIGLNIRQDIPIIIHPKGLPVLADPWKLLEWSVDGGVLNVANPSAYVVRLAQEVTLLPSFKKTKLEKTYILPGEKIKVSEADAAALKNSSEIQITSLSKYGYLVGDFKLPLSHND
ncbi:fimbria/pilus chaperone family protein [Erwinia sp. AnSW2-5]|uniref:fimbria/pilus chaperone family protein n=1 Tax=Erwinia sp. AnSW2-5 TaxID=3367692 RepID=UPI00385C31FD